MWLTFRRVVKQSGWALSLFMAAAVLGQETASHSISVIGRGKVKVVPTTAELVGVISAESELAGDALTKFRSTKQSAIEAFAKLGIPELSLTTSGFGIGPSGGAESATQVILNRSRGITPEPPKISVQESVRLQLRAIDKLTEDQLFDTLAKITDTAKESSVTLGPPLNPNRISVSRDDYLGYVTFLIEDSQPAREQAEAQAIQDARARAEYLAKLTGCRLGEVRSVRDLQRTTDVLPSSLRQPNPEQPPKFDPIEITAVLQFDFKLLPLNGS